MLSSSSGTYLGTGTVLTQTNNVVQVRNPPRPPARENEIVVELLQKQKLSVTRNTRTLELLQRRRGGWGRSDDEEEEEDLLEEKRKKKKTT